MDELRIRKFFSNQTMNCQTVVFLLKKIHSSLSICNQFHLGRVILLSSNKREWIKKWELDSISIPQLQRGLMQFWKLWLNLCSHRWLSLTRSRVISLVPLWLYWLHYCVTTIRLSQPSKIKFLFPFSSFHLSENSCFYRRIFH